MGVKGGGLDQLKREETERLEQLIGTLPDDDSKLPPPGHRLVLQVANGSEVLARVYDRANAPQAVLEILRLSHSHIRPLTLDFPPQKKWPLTEFGETGIPSDAIGIRGPDMEESTILAISPDRYLTVRQVLHDTPAVTITDTNPSNVIRTLREPQVLDRHVGITHAEFTPDGRYLLLLSTLPAVRIYDTTDWKQVRSLPDLPPSAASYFPSSDWTHGIFVNAAGDVGLWDSKSRIEVAKLDTDGKPFDISFSPDNSMFAITSGHQNKDFSSTFHLRVWSAVTGELIHELRPFEQTARDDIGAPIWWSDGMYLLATVRDNPMGSNHDIGIWSIRSGRFRGEFSGCVYSSDPLSLVLHDQKLFERCRDGMILMWDAASAIKRITQFENPSTESAGTE
jgi:WD40 repeat protein